CRHLPVRPAIALAVGGEHLVFAPAPRCRRLRQGRAQFRTELANTAASRVGSPEQGEGCEPRDKAIISFGEETTIALSRMSDAYVRTFESCGSHHRRMVHCADSTKPLAPLGDSDGQDW